MFLSNLAKVRGRGQVEVADRWKDEVKACPAHKPGEKKGKKCLDHKPEKIVLAPHMYVFRASL